MNNKRNLQKPIDSKSPNLLNEIKAHLYRNKDQVLIFKKIKPLINNPDFMNFVLENKVSFTSQEDKDIADCFSEMLSKVSTTYKRKNFLKTNNNKLTLDSFVKEIGPVIERVKTQGHSEHCEIAKRLNQYGVLSRRSAKWDKRGVNLVWEKWTIMKADFLNQAAPIFDVLTDEGCTAATTKAYVLNLKGFKGLYKDDWDAFEVTRIKKLLKRRPVDKIRRPIDQETIGFSSVLNL